MRLAVIADIHANLAALEAVLEAVASTSSDAILCLGDLIGYGAEPNECVQLVRQHIDVCVVGNHDHDMLAREAREGTKPSARSVQTWTRERLDTEALQYIRALPRHVVYREAIQVAHGCYLNDSYYYGYVTSTMLELNLRAIGSHQACPSLALCGHTHCPLAGWLMGDHVSEHTGSIDVRWPARAEAVLLNPGSVGQPRDGDPRASFMVVDVEGRRAEVRRVDYDIERTVSAIKHCGLPEQFAERLREGR